jgi:hypothetical protein
MADYEDLGTDTIGSPMYKPSDGPATRGRGLREQLEAAHAALSNPDVLRTLGPIRGPNYHPPADQGPQARINELRATTSPSAPAPDLISGANKMSDLSPGLIQQVIDRLRALAGSGQQLPVGQKQPIAAGASANPIDNMSEVDRMAAGLPPRQR